MGESSIAEISRHKARVTDLTEREVIVLRLLSRGLSNRRIARTLEISEKTVKNHLSGIYAKIHVTDRTQATLYALRTGVADPRSVPGTPLQADSGDAAACPTPLTPREKGVLALLSRGLSNRRIARTLEISEKTVKNHLSGIYAKIHVTDRTQALLYARRTGLS
uniref:LuxR-like transcriptional regulator n=1 Tax=Streptomyces argillaceus TaxID=41951 RepID=A0A1M4NDE4_STRAA|nr:LuxR-like transcriptional regulator [Streptomyces argillaceus]